MDTDKSRSTAEGTPDGGGIPAADPGGHGPTFHPDPAKVARAIAKRSFCTLATTSPSGRPHAAAVLYAAAGGSLYVSTDRSSRKARNIADNPRVGVVIPVRRLPVGPPSTVHFQTVAEILAVDDPGVRRLAGDGRLKAVTSHGELDLPDGCVLRITLPRRVLTYGLGMPLRRLLRDPLNAAGVVELDLP